MLCTNKGWNSILRKPADCVPSVETNEQKRSKEFTVKYSGILTLLFPRKRRRSSPSPFICNCVLEAAESRILKSLLVHEGALANTRQI